MPRSAPLRDDLDGVRVGQEVALLDRVGGVLLPAVVLVHGAERGVDAAGGERGVRILPRALADREHVDAPLGDLDRRAQAGAARADDEDGGGDLSFASGHAFHARNERPITPMHTSA